MKAPYGQSAAMAAWRLAQRPARRLLPLAVVPLLLGARAGPAPSTPTPAPAPARPLPLVAPAPSVPPSQRSGFDFMTPALQAMQRSDAQNPGMLWVANGAELWKASPGNGTPACAGCHASGMAGAAARYPAFSEALQRPVTLLQQINRCRTQRQEQPAWPKESEQLLALAAYLGQQSRGLRIEPPRDDRLTPWREAGESLFRARIGQLHLSCAQCHEERAGQRLAGAVIPSGLATGYPLYRLEWQGMGSLPRRLLNCTTGVRAAPLSEDELTQVELYLMQRANGLAWEGPAVRP